MTLKQLIEDTDTPWGRIFDLFTQGLIIFSLIAFSIETLPDLSQDARNLLQTSEVVVVIIFTVEYLLRLYVSDRKLGFIFSFFGIVDLLAIAPFYIATGIDLRAVRVFRLFRLVRIFKLARYSRAAQRFQRAFLIAREEVILFSVMTLILLHLSAAGIYFFENEAQPEQFKSVFHSLWWALATLTTVGYGDVYPITAGGRVFTFLVLMVGLGVIAVPAGLVASSLSKARELEDLELEDDSPKSEI